VGFGARVNSGFRGVGVGSAVDRGTHEKSGPESGLGFKVKNRVQVLVVFAFMSVDRVGVFVFFFFITLKPKVE